MENLNLIRKIAWSYVRRYPGADFDDLFGEACLAYLEARGRYNPDKAKESTFIWHVVNNHLKDFIGGIRRRVEVEILTDADNLLMDSEEMGTAFPLRDPVPSPEQVLLTEERWNETKAGLSAEALRVCDIALNGKEIYLPMDKPKLCRGILRRALREIGWKWEKIWNAFRELKAAFSAL